MGEQPQTAKTAADIPHFDLSRRGGRVVQLCPARVEGEWHSWIPDTRDGGYLRMRPLDITGGIYLSPQVVHEADIFVPFVDFVYQRISYPIVAKAERAIVSDIYNFAASLGKIQHFWDHRELFSDRFALSQFVRTELEYLLIVARSVLDHVYEIFVGAWAKIRLLDEASNAVKKQRSSLPSLSKLCLQGQRVRSAEELTGSLPLPGEFARYFVELGKFLLKVRAMRDGVVHSGMELGPVFVGQRGFALAKGGSLAQSFGTEWCDHDFENDNLLSLNKFVATLVAGSLEQGHRLAVQLTQHFDLLPPLAPGLRVFLRSAHAPHVLRAVEVANGRSPWSG